MSTSIKINDKHLIKTSRGRIICKSFEIYNRNDVGCGSLFCQKCIYLQPLKPTLSEKIYLIPDLSTIKHQIDIITSPIFLSKFNVILLQSIIQNIKKTNYSLYKRIKSELIECYKYNASIYIFMNKFKKNTNVIGNHQFKQVISVYKWYNMHLSLHLNKNNCDYKLFIITESAKKVKLLKLLNVKSFKIDVFIKTLFPTNLSNLQDSLSSVVVDNDNDKDKDNKLLYQSHWKMNRVEMELKINKNNKIFRGKYISIRGYGKNAYGKVICDNHHQIYIYGPNNINRAIHDDIVCVKLIDDDDE